MSATRIPFLCMVCGWVGHDLDDHPKDCPFHGPERMTVHKQVIWKYFIESFGVNRLSMPMGAVILTAAAQGGFSCVWALVDPDKVKVARRILVATTGAEIPPGGLTGARFIGTVLLHEGSLVVHCFDLGEDKMEGRDEEEPAEKENDQRGDDGG